MPRAAGRARRAPAPGSAVRRRAGRGWVATARTPARRPWCSPARLRRAAPDRRPIRGPALEVLDGGVQDDFLRAGRRREIANRGVHVVEQRVGDAAHFLEAPLGAARLRRASRRCRQPGRPAAAPPRSAVASGGGRTAWPGTPRSLGARPAAARRDGGGCRRPAPPPTDSGAPVPWSVAVSTMVSRSPRSRRAPAASPAACRVDARGRHRRLHDRAFQGHRGRRVHRLRPRAGEDLEQHQAQGVDVGARRHRLAAQLLGAAVRRREGQQPGGRRRGVAAFHQLRDAEVEQLAPSRRRPGCCRASGRGGSPGSGARIRRRRRPGGTAAGARRRRAGGRRRRR